MQWTKPEFKEISLNMEVTAYVNTDDIVPPCDEKSARLTEQDLAADECALAAV